MTVMSAGGSGTDSAVDNEQLTIGLPAEHLPWPFGMPTSIAPMVAVIGASPGSSPATSEASPIDYRPTVARVHPGFYYPDTSHYWAKIRSLCTAVARCYAPSASEEEALALAGHFNLGTGLAGAATLGVVEPKIVTWLSGLLGSRLPVRVLVCVGLNAILKEPAVSHLWNNAPCALRVEWDSPQVSEPFQGYRFRLWRAQRSDGEPVLVCMWPNHPSRVPFTGPIGQNWQAAVDRFCGIVRKFQPRTVR